MGCRGKFWHRLAVSTHCVLDRVRGQHILHSNTDLSAAPDRCASDKMDEVLAFVSSDLLVMHLPSRRSSVVAGLFRKSSAGLIPGVFICWLGIGSLVTRRCCRIGVAGDASRRRAVAGFLHEVVDEAETV